MNNQEYEQKKRECLRDFCKEHGFIETADVKGVFGYAFDRAYAFGKETETITQEEIEKASVEYADKTAKQYEVCNSEFVQEIMVAFEQGAKFALGKQEKDADTVISGWVARDGSGSLNVFNEEPTRDEELEMWSDGLDHFGLPYSSFPDLTWESDPQEVEIILKRKKK